MRNFYIDFFKADDNNAKFYVYKVIPNNFLSPLKLKLFNPPAYTNANLFTLFYIPHKYSINSTFYSDFSYKYFISKWKKYELKKIYNSSFKSAQIFPNFSKSYSSFQPSFVSGFKNLCFKRRNRVWLFLFTKFSVGKNSVSRYFKFPPQTRSSMRFSVNRKKSLRYFKYKKKLTFIKYFRLKRKFRNRKNKRKDKIKDKRSRKVKKNKLYIRKRYFVSRNFIFKFSNFFRRKKLKVRFANFRLIFFYFKKYKKFIINTSFWHPFGQRTFFKVKYKKSKYFRFFRRKKNRIFNLSLKKIYGLVKLRTAYMRFKSTKSLDEIFLFIFNRYFKEQKSQCKNFSSFRDHRFFDLPLSSNRFTKFILQVFSHLDNKNYKKYKSYFSFLFFTFIRLRYIFCNFSFICILRKFEAFKFQFFKTFFNLFKMFTFFSTSFISLTTRITYPNDIFHLNYYFNFFGKQKFLSYYKRRTFIKLFRTVTFYKFVLSNLLFSKHYKLFFKLKKKFIMFCYFYARNGRGSYIFPLLFSKNFYVGTLSLLRFDIFSYNSTQVRYSATTKPVSSRILLISNF